MKQGAIVTAAMLAIGDELLSGRTKDRNIAYLADFCTLAGIDLREARIVADDRPAIVKAVNQLRGEVDYLFTSGGIGPTHDDITADAIAQAFGVHLPYHQPTLERMEENYRKRGIAFTPARKRMARIPEGGIPIANPVSVAPGFTIENVHVMAGVPAIFEAMLDSLAPRLRTGARMLSETVDCNHPEGTIGSRLAMIQNDNPAVAIGSYPRYEAGVFSTSIVVRGRESAAIAAAVDDVKRFLDELDGDLEAGDR